MSLSDKRMELSNFGLEATESLGGAVKFYREEDVRKAVKELKRVIANIRDTLWYQHDMDILEKKVDEILGEV